MWVKVHDHWLNADLIVAIRINSGEFTDFEPYFKVKVDNFTNSDAIKLFKELNNIDSPCEDFEELKHLANDFLYIVCTHNGSMAFIINKKFIFSCQALVDNSYKIIMANGYSFTVSSQYYSPQDTEQSNTTIGH